MTRKFVTITLFTALFFTACTETAKKETADTTTGPTEKVDDDISKVTFTDKDGKVLELSINNTKGTATVLFNGETIEMAEQKAASGIWYKNDQYELRGKGNDLDLLKDGKVIFTHQDSIVTSSLKDKDGQTLDITFNNTTNTAKVYLNGGEQIELVNQKPASGIWYKNDHYELRGKGDKLEYTRDGKTIFKN